MEKITLSDLQTMIGNAIGKALPDYVWLTAEIGEVKEHPNGHCYLDLIDYSQDGNGVLAKARAVIWSSSYKVLKPFFETSTGSSLQEGMHLLMRVQVQYSNLYGLSLIVNDIDPSFTVGELELLKQKTIARLKQEGMFDMNSSLELPVLPKRFAIISSITAAGYIDFTRHLAQNEEGFVFYTKLFSAPMQGEEAPAGIINALDEVAAELAVNEREYDAVILVRGGGAAMTPPCFTSIEREIRGLSTVEYLAADKCYVINPVKNESSLFRLNTSNAGEYFLFECRAKSGWDKYIGGEGLVVYHVDKSNIVYGGIESSKRWLYNNVNAYAMHECAKVFPSGGADTKLVCDLFYPGTFGITSISASGEPAFVDWNSKTTGISISGITFKNNTITLNTNGEYALDPSLPKVKNVAFSPYQYDCRLAWIRTTSSTSCKWRIIWKEKSAREYPDTNLLVTEEYSVLIHDLVPGKDYIIQIESLQGNFVGETYKDIFKTLAVTSRFPYMNLTGSYKVGDFWCL